MKVWARKNPAGVKTTFKSGLRAKLLTTMERLSTPIMFSEECFITESRWFNRKSRVLLYKAHLKFLCHYYHSLLSLLSF